MRTEQAAMWALLPAVRRYIEATGIPDGYNIGINAGEAAGQTVAHAHVHVCDSPISLRRARSSWRHTLDHPSQGAVLGDAVSDPDQRGAIGFAEGALELLDEAGTPPPDSVDAPCRGGLERVRPAC